MDKISIQIPAKLFGELYARFKDQTTDVITNSLTQLLDSKQSESKGDVLPTPEELSPPVNTRLTEDQMTLLREYLDKRPVPSWAKRPNGKKTGTVWNIADQLNEKGKADRQSVIVQCIPEHITASTANTQYSHWKKSQGVMAYQDRTLMENDLDDARHTDAELVDLWHRKFPDALHLKKRNADGIYTYVRDIRRCFNQGKEGHGQRNEDGNIVGQPPKLSPPYNESRESYVYSDRWLEACNKGRSTQ